MGIVVTIVAMPVTDEAVRRAGPFDLLIVDEASMAAVLLLIAYQGLARRLPLFGDFRQLPPVTASDDPWLESGWAKLALKCGKFRTPLTQAPSLPVNAWDPVQNTPRNTRDSFPICILWQIARCSTH